MAELVELKTEEEFVYNVDEQLAALSPDQSVSFLCLCITDPCANGQ